MTTLYETIFTRRQVRQFLPAPLPADTLRKIEQCVQEAGHLHGQRAGFRLVPAAEVSSKQGAPHYLMAYCDTAFAAYADAGFVMQKADLYVQSMGLASGWFMSAKPRQGDSENRFCIALAIGQSDTPLRGREADFKRKPLSAVCDRDSPVARAVRLAPSSLNSQPWQISCALSKVILRDAGHGISRVILKNKLNKIDLGIAARHAVLALEHEGQTVKDVIPKTDGDAFSIEITY